MFRLWWLWWSTESSRSLAHLPPTTVAVILNVLFLLLGSLLLGGAAAVIAHELDQRISIAADVEHIVGAEPMAQLPDFSQVSGAATEEHLMRLATRIDAVTKDRRMKTCVFTGAGFGAGTTTVATRVKEGLEKLGRVVVMEDRAWSANLPPEQGSQAPAASNRTWSPLRTRKDGAKSVWGEIVLIDAAPLAHSAATERILHRADCAIVVIQSGVTTATQLRHTVNVLQNLHLPFVGLVLNRLQPAKADAAFRDSLKQIDHGAHSQKITREKKTLWQLHHALDSGRSNRGHEAETGAPAAPLSIAAAISAAAPQEMLDEVLAAKPISLPEMSGHSKPRQQEHAPGKPAHGAEEIPWWLREPKAKLQATITLPRVHGTRGKRPASKSSRESEWQKPGLQEAAVAAPQTSDLGGAILSPKTEELDRVRQEPRDDDEIALLMGAIAPFEAMFNPQAQVTTAYSASDEVDHSGAAYPWTLASDPEGAPVAVGGDGDDSRPAAVQPESVHSRSAEPERGEFRSADDGDHSLQRPHLVTPESGAGSEGFRTLPSRNGQYKPNDREYRSGRR
jgi:hypothetical protein